MNRNDGQKLNNDENATGRSCARLMPGVMRYILCIGEHSGGREDL